MDIGSTARDVLQYGALGLLALAIVGAGYLALRGGRAIWATVESFFTGLLGEFRRSNDNAIQLHGKLDLLGSAHASEHEKTRGEIRALAPTIAREIHSAREQIEETIHRRTSDVRDDLSDEMRRTGEHTAINAEREEPVPAAPSRRGPRAPVSAR